MKATRNGVVVAESDDDHECCARWNNAWDAASALRALPLVQQTVCVEDVTTAR